VGKTVVLSQVHLAFFLGKLRRGGAEQVMLTLAREFARRGARVDLVLGDLSDIHLRAMPTGINVVEIGVPGRFEALLQWFHLPASAWTLALTKGNPRLLRSVGRLAHYLRRERPDALLATLRSANITAIWAGILAATSTKIIIREANTQSLESLSEKKNFKRNFPKIARRWFPKADGIVAVSHAVAEDLVRITELSAETVTVIYNPVDVRKIRELASKDPKDPWLTPEGSPVFVSAGRLVPQKDQSTLLDAFAKVRAGHAARLMIFGAGAARSMLEARAKNLKLTDVVRFMGSVENPYQYFTRAHAFVLSSVWEGFPNVLVEALACGCPVISTDCPSGPMEILQAGTFGTLVPVGNASALADAMIATFATKADPERLRKRAEFFSVEHAFERYRSVLLGS